MRTLGIMGLAFIGAASHLNAQRVHQFEFSGFASFTRYDRAFALKNQIGGGGRVGYFFTRVLGAELEGGLGDAETVVFLLDRHLGRGFEPPVRYSFTGDL